MELENSLSLIKEVLEEIVYDKNYRIILLQKQQNWFTSINK